jgi:hypothetical protein
LKTSTNNRKEQQMAVKLIANYAKRLGLPGYSSHQFSVSVETELHDLKAIAQESEKLYGSLQNVVDQQIQKTGFVPPDGYGTEGDKNGNWNCSQKQRELIEKIGKENNVHQNALDQLADQMFGAKVQALNKLQASGLIDELLDRYGKRTQRSQYGRRYVGRTQKGANA